MLFLCCGTSSMPRMFKYFVHKTDPLKGATFVHKLGKLYHHAWNKAGAQYMCDELVCALFCVLFIQMLCSSLAELTFFAGWTP